MQRDLHEQVKGQRQQGGVLILLTVSRHEQQKQHDEQILRIKVPGKELAEELENPGIVPGLRILTWGLLWRRTGPTGLPV